MSRDIDKAKPAASPSTIGFPSSKILYPFSSSNSKVSLQQQQQQLQKSSDTNPNPNPNPNPIVDAATNNNKTSIEDFSKRGDELKFKTGNCNFLFENSIRQGFLVAEANSLNGMCILNFDRDSTDPIKTFSIGGASNLKVIAKDTNLVLTDNSSSASTWLIFDSKANALVWGRFLTSSVFSNPLAVTQKSKTGMAKQSSSESSINDPPAVSSFNRKQQQLCSIPPLSSHLRESTGSGASIAGARGSISERFDRDRDSARAILKVGADHSTGTKRLSFNQDDSTGTAISANSYGLLRNEIVASKDPSSLVIDPRQQNRDRGGGDGADLGAVLNHVHVVGDGRGHPDRTNREQRRLSDGDASGISALTEGSMDSQQQGFGRAVGGGGRGGGGEEAIEAPVRPCLAARPSYRTRPTPAGQVQAQRQGHGQPSQHAIQAQSKAVYNYDSHDSDVPLNQKKTQQQQQQQQQQQHAQMKSSMQRTKLLEDALLKATHETDTKVAVLRKFKRKAAGDIGSLAQERQDNLDKQEVEELQKLKKTQDKLQVQLAFEKQLRLNISNMQQKEEEESEALRVSRARALQLERERLEKRFLDDIEKERRLVEQEPVSIVEENKLMMAEEKIAKKVVKKENKALQKVRQMKINVELQRKNIEEEKENIRAERLNLVLQKMKKRKVAIIQKYWKLFRHRTDKQIIFLAKVIHIQSYIRRYIARKLFLVMANLAIERALQTAKMVLVFQLTIFVVRYKRKKRQEVQNMGKVLELILVRRKVLIMKRAKQAIAKAKLAATTTHQFKREMFFSNFGQAMTLVYVNKESSELTYQKENLNTNKALCSKF